jgi:preprotein translocase subunit SecG
MSPLNIIEVILAVLLILAILLQNRGAGLGTSWGGSGEFYMTRRGLEKFLFRGTVVIAIAFFLVAFLNVFGIK